MSFYIISLKHTGTKNKYITLERVNNCGYAYPLVWAGKFNEDEVLVKENYLNTGLDTLAVSCDVLEKISIQPEKGMIDGDTGPVVLNNKANWSIILNSLTLIPKNKPCLKCYRASRKNLIK